MKFKKKTVLGICLGFIIILSTIFIVFALSEKKKSKDKNEKSIQTVVAQIFTCPNKEMIKLYSDMEEVVAEEKNLLPPETKIYSPSEESYSEINKKIEEMYAPYILNRWYESFVKQFEMKYVVYSITNEYETKVDHIKITQSDTIPTNYSFTIYLHCGPIAGEKKDIEIKGSAQFTEENGKISYIKFFDKELYPELQSRAN